MLHATPLVLLTAATTWQKALVMMCMAVLVHDIIFAQAAAQGMIDPISGGAAWVGQGILGGVFGWILFVAWPAKDKAAREDRESRDTAIRELTDRYNAAIKQLVERHDAETKAQTERFTAAITEMAVKQSEVERDRRHDHRDQLNAITLHFEQEREFTSKVIRSNIEEQRALMVDIRRNIEESRRPPPPGPGRAPRGNVIDPDVRKG